jgi:uncharacterized membrane protein YsdA (DUF1294 family)
MTRKSPERAGRPAAPVRPTPVRARPNTRPRRRTDPRRLFLLVGLAITLLAAAALRWATASPWVVTYLLAVNVTTAALYAYDKRAAAAGRLRVPERTLHLWALLGGTPAAYASQRLFRHKTRRDRFQTWFWAIFAVQLALVAGWCWQAAGH